MVCVMILFVSVFGRICGVVFCMGLLQSQMILSCMSLCKISYVQYNLLAPTLTRQLLTVTGWVFFPPLLPSPSPNTPNRVSYHPGWPQTLYVTEDELQLQNLLPPSPLHSGFCHSWDRSQGFVHARQASKLSLSLFFSNLETAQLI